MVPVHRGRSTRAGRSTASARWRLAAAGTGLALVTAVGILGAVSHRSGGAPPPRRPAHVTASQPHRPASAEVWAPGWQNRVRPAVAALANDLPDVYERGCHANHRQTTVTVCADGPQDAGHAVLTIGDSHAASWQPALAALAEELHWRNLSATKSACTVWDVPTTVVAAPAGYTACDTWRHNAFALAERVHPAVVILHSAVPWNYMLDAAGRQITRWADKPPALTRAVRSSVTSARRSGAKVVVMLDVPMASAPLAMSTAALQDCLAAAAAPTACDFPSTAAELSRQVLRTAAVAAGAVVVDPYPVICPGRMCHVVQGDTVAYRNAGHLTRTYALQLRGWVAAWLRPLVTSAPPHRATRQ